MNKLNYLRGASSRSILIITALVFLIIVTLYAMGFRLGTYGFGRASNVEILNLPGDTEVFVDNESRGLKEGSFRLTLSPGYHSIILSKQLHWPYIENILIGKVKNDLTLNPFLLPQNPSGVLIGSGDPEFTAINSLFSIGTLPSAENPLISSDNNVSVYLSGGVVIAKWIGEEANTPSMFCTENVCSEKVIFNPITEVRNIGFFKDRNDVLIIAMQDGIFALELDPSEVQNLQPILEGNSPDFRLSDDGKLYAKDENTLMLINI